jgi:hypothetical protein
MDDEFARLQAKVEALGVALEGLERRLSAVETATGATRVTAGRAVPDDAPAAPQLGGTAQAAARVLPLVGRAFLVFAGAWFLRALTDSGTLPVAGGIALGLAYAIAWFVLAERSARAAAGLSAEFHGVTAALIAYPLVFEATTKFAVLRPAAATGVLVVLTALGFAIAWRRNLPALAWAVTLAGLGSAFASLVTTHAMEVYSAFLVLLGVASVWLTYERHWFGLRWITAAVVDLVVAEMVALVSRAEGPPEAYRALSAPVVEGIAVALLVLYLGTIAIRTLVRRRDVNVFEILQTLASLVVGFGGAVAVARALGSGRTGLAAAALASGAASYAVAFAFVDRRLGRGLNFAFYTSLGLVFVLVGSFMAASGATLTLVWCALATTAAVLGRLFNRAELRAHAAIYLLAASVASGLLLGALAAFGKPVSATWAPVSRAEVLALAAAVACYLILATASRSTDVRWPARLPQLAAAVLAVAAAAAGLVVVAVRFVAPAALGADAGSLAALRTAVLAATALLLAAVGPRGGLLEMSWLVYPVLVAGGVKLLVQDFPQGRPATLAVAFVAYGLALILAPRLLRRPAAPAVPVDTRPPE